MRFTNSNVRSPEEIMSQKTWLNDPNDESFGQEMRSHLGSSDLSNELKEKLYEKIIRFLTSAEALEMLAQKREESPEATCYEEAGLFISQLTNAGYSETNLAHLLDQANAGCLEDPHDHDIKNMLRDFKKQV